MEVTVIKGNKHTTLSHTVASNIEGKHIHIQVYAGKLMHLKISNSCEQEIVDEIVNAYNTVLSKEDERTFNNRLIKMLVEIQKKYNFTIILDYSQIFDLEPEK